MELFNEFRGLYASMIDTAEGLYRQYNDDALRLGG